MDDATENEKYAKYDNGEFDPTLTPKEIIERGLHNSTKKFREEKKAEKRIEIASKLAQRTGFLYSAREFIKEQPVYYDRNGIWWLWDTTEQRWGITDETDVLTIITQSMQLYGDVSVKSKGHMVEALKQEGRLNKPKDFPKNWIQFKDRVYDLQTGNTYPVSSEYFCVNPIPWKIGATEETPNISRLFDEWVGAENTQTLYEIIAYLCYADYPIHIIVCLVGTGRNGKSKFLSLAQKFLGKENISSTELEQLFENRFETFKLYKKLACLMGETNFNTIRNTSLLKRLTGQDLIGFEAKGKNPFDDYNYAKILISTNALPTSDDTSDGFYRRWMILEFPNEFPEGKDILNDIPDEEYENLARIVTKILPELLERGLFSKQGSIEERKKKYIETSNPLLIFTNQYCVKEENAKVLYTSLFTKYVHWLSESKRRVVTRKEFSQMLEREGHEIQKTTLKNEYGEYEKGNFIFGIRFKESIIEFDASSPYTPVTPVTPVLPVQSLTIEANIESRRNGSIESTARLNYGKELVPQEMKVSTTWQEWLNDQPGGTAEIDDFLREFPLLDCDKLLREGEVYSPRPGFIRRVL